MKTDPAVRSNPEARRGSAMVTVMLVVVVSMIAVGSLFAFTTSTTHRIRILTEAIRAKAIAEAGASRGYSDLTASGLNTPETLYDDEDFAGGRYSVTCASVASNWIRMISIGTFGRAEHRVGVDVRFAAVDDGDADDNIPSFLDAFHYGIFCNGAFTINGTPKDVDGDLHANGSFTLNGTYDNVDGKVSAPPPNSIPASHKADWVEIPFPQLSDPAFQTWIAEQEAAGIAVTRLNGSQTFKKDHDFTGITLINGSVTFIGSGERNIAGILYISGSLTANGSTTLNGSILVGGSLTINGASAILTYANITGSGGEEGDEDEDQFEIAQEVWWD